MTDTVTISAEEYRYLINLKQDMEDALFVSKAMAEIAAGAPTIPASDLDAYLSAPTPLAYWRKRAGKTQADLAAAAGISQAFIAQIEAGRRDGTVSVLARIAEALGVRIDDLVDADRENDVRK